MDLYTHTARTGLYDLRDGSTVRNELESYQAALALLEPLLMEIEGAYSTRVMSRAQLERVCRLYGRRVPRGISTETLRACAEPLSWSRLRTREELQRWLRGQGARVNLTEQPDGSVLVTGEALGGLLPDMTALRCALQGCLPVGAPAAVLDFGTLTWEMLDARGFTALELDEKDVTWAWFDLYGQLLLGEEL